MPGGSGGSGGSGGGDSWRWPPWEQLCQVVQFVAFIWGTYHLVLALKAATAFMNPIKGKELAGTLSAVSAQWSAL